MKITAHPLVRFDLGFTSHQFFASSEYIKGHQSALRGAPCVSQNSGIFKFGYHFWRETTPDRGAPMNATAHPLVRFVLGFTYQYFLAPWAYFKSVFGLFYGIHITIFEQSGKQRGIRLYVYSGKLIFAAMYLRRVRVVSTPPMKHVSTAPRLRQKTLRGPSATLTGAGKCWYARGDGADRPAPAA